ncbi:MAG: AAA family ATPase [Sphingomonas sp.]|uniref:AAA family ATPase n=1 Tax=Sphingomonas sp. TaxID=28214 RepID=UPI001AFEA3FF|nr:AAA family ATPase [Sphingomonas sp.]MBO9623791.1 AAA family ATPase [Sphingomonas sp.]
MAASAATEMATFEALLGRGGLDPSAVHRLADRIGAAHIAAAPADGTAFRRRLAALATSPEQRAELERRQAVVVRRAQIGRVRALPEGPSDLLFDLARPLMELVRHDQPADANILANRYLDVTPQGATGWSLLPLFLSLRASAAGDPALAEAVLKPCPPRLVAIGGLSGTGKSTLSRLLGHRLGRAPGARVLRWDVFCKRLQGLPPEKRLPPRHYTRQTDMETYEAMFESAQDHLECGTPVILDAVFMSRSEREVAQALAARARVPFTGIWLEAPEQERVARVRERLHDASDADERVVREQSKRSVGDLFGWHRMRVNRPLETIVAAARGALERR